MSANMFLDKLLEALNELATRILKLEKESLVLTEDNLAVCKGCLKGEHAADKYSVPDCAILGCNCVCAG